MIMQLNTILRGRSHEESLVDMVMIFITYYEASICQLLFSNRRQQISFKMIFANSRAGLAVLAVLAERGGSRVQLS